MLLGSWALFFSWGRTAGVRGGLILSVISTPKGRASLSQFQIMVWTLLLATGLTYVMLLSKNLIDIPATALGLLGISGAATVGAKLKTGTGGAIAAPNAPGAVTGLTQQGNASASAVTLSWAPLAPADPTATFTIQRREHGTSPWSTINAAITTPPFTVNDLTPQTCYDFQVFASNVAGSGPASAPLEVTTGATPGLGAVAPDAVVGLAACSDKCPQGGIRLTWAGAAPAPTAHVVQYRHAGEWAWSTAGTATTSPYTVRGLEPGTDYEFQVFAMNQGRAGLPSPLVAARTDPRKPRWADLLVDDDNGTEINVTRLQMFLFTVIAAGFVALNLFYNEQIPAIPTGILTLMGLSNGVYLGAKFAS